MIDEALTPIKRIFSCRHCERSEAIHSFFVGLWIASFVGLWIASLRSQ
jgi:hypothetical protein